MKLKFNTPFPQALPKECAKAANIFRSFVDTRNEGLDGVIPRSVLEHAKGFAIFSVFKAGLVFSARAGSGIVIAKLADGTWSAPSAIGTAGMGFGSQLGAEVTDFLIVLNSRSAVKSFMAAGSLTLGGNMSVALGPLGRNGEASSSVNTNGSVAMMYSYSKTKGLFGGLSVEGSIIVERQDANALAYESDVTAKMLLSGIVPSPPWSRELIKTLENCTGLPGGRTWIPDGLGAPGYAFESGVASPSTESPRRRKMNSVSSFPPAAWGRRKDGGSYFESEPGDSVSTRTPRLDSPPVMGEPDSTTFPTPFDSELSSHTRSKSKHDTPSLSSDQAGLIDAPSPHDVPSLESISNLPPYSTNPFLQSKLHSQRNPFISSKHTYEESSMGSTQKTLFSAQPRAIALFDFKAIEPGDLAFSRGDIIIVTEKSDQTNDWWTGMIDERRGIFPANFVELM